MDWGYLTGRKIVKEVLKKRFLAKLFQLPGFPLNFFTVEASYNKLNAFAAFLFFYSGFANRFLQDQCYCSCCKSCWCYYLLKDQNRKNFARKELIQIIGVSLEDAMTATTVGSVLKLSTCNEGRNVGIQFSTTALFKQEPICQFDLRSLYEKEVYSEEVTIFLVKNELNLPSLKMLFPLNIKGEELKAKDLGEKKDGNDDEFWYYLQRMPLVIPFMISITRKKYEDESKT